jgi:alkanesulfonate monooxygenase SsuD/methylene tetrahydromethanopterin reductase-like flavin-dependent oxidoreductase (luciferase family)
MGGDHFQKLKGYEYYAEMSKQRAQLAGDRDIADLMAEMYMANHVWGTPDECIEKIQGLCDAFHPEEFMLVFRHGSMSKAVADASTRLFAKEVLPAVHEIPTEAPIDYVAQPA